MKLKGDVVGLVSEPELVCLSLSSFVAVGIFCAYRNEGFPSFCCASLFVQIRRSKGGPVRFLKSLECREVCL